MIDAVDEDPYSSDDSVKDKTYTPDCLNSMMELECSQQSSSQQSVDVDELIIISKKKRQTDTIDFSSYYKIYQTNEKEKYGLCKLCEKRGKNIKIKMKLSNTTGLKRHIQSVHKEVDKRHPDKLLNPVLDMFKNNNANAKTTSQKNIEWNSMLVKWIATKYLPFNFFEDEATQNIFRHLNKSVELPKRTNLRNLTMKTFSEMQSLIKQLLEQNSSKISLTVDGWTSIANKSYYGITAHFIDDTWSLKSLVLDFVPANGKHTGKDIADTIYESLQKYNIAHKINGITLDNASANTSFINELSSLLGNTVFDKDDSHFRCFAHILNLAVQDILKVINANDVNDEQTDEEEEIETTENDYPITKLRKLFFKIRRSEQWHNKLKICCDALNIKLVTPNADISTRWNSTNDMLIVALKMKNALNALCEHNDDLKAFKIDEDNWNLFSEIQKVLKHFKSLSIVLGGENYSTLPLVVIGFNMLLDKLESTINELITSPDPDNRKILIEAYQAAYSKLMKHYAKTNWIYCAVLILDPRHKLSTFNLTKWGEEMKEASLKKFDDIFLNQYYKPNIQVQEESAPVVLDNDYEEDADDVIDLCSLFEDFEGPSELCHDNSRREIDVYLSLPRESKNIEILKWWKQHERAYPNLSKMARDLLSIPATSVPAERLFSKAGLTIRKHRNRLSHDSARSLLCLNSWFSSNLLAP